MTNRIIGLALCGLLLNGCGDDDGGGAGAPDANAGMTPDAASAADADNSTADAAPVALRGVSVAMTGMTPHVTQLMEFRVVNSMNMVMARGVLDALPAAMHTFRMPNSTPEGMGYRMDFTADLNGNGTYDAPPVDHAWTLPIGDTGMQGLTFAHNTTFDDIDDPAVTEMGGDFSLDISGMMPHVAGTQLLEVRVIMAASGRTAGVYFIPDLNDATKTLTIPGIIKDGVDYQVDFYADLNGNGSYDAPPADHAWRLTGTGTATGLSLTFAHNTTFTDIGF